MLEAALRSGAADRRCVFEAFARRLPEGRRYGVVAGTGRFLEALQEFRFGDAEIDDLRRRRVVDEATCDWLAGYRFSGDVSGYAEGEAYFPGSPVLVVESSFAIFDSDRRTVQFFRVPYDYTKTQRSILKAGLPSILAERLAYGT